MPASVPTADEFDALAARVAALEAAAPDPAPGPGRGPGPEQPAVLAAPTRLAALADQAARTITLRWDPVAGAESYNVYELTSDIGRAGFRGIKGTDSVRGPLGDPREYQWQVTAVAGEVESARTPVVAASIGRPTTPAPGTDSEPKPSDPGPKPGRGDGTAYWSDGPDSPVGASLPFRNWDNTPWNYAGRGAMSIVSDPVKGRAIRSIVPAGVGETQRAEIVPAIDDIRSGTELWLGFDLLVPSAKGLARSHQQVMQLKSFPSESSAVFSVNVNNHREGLVVGNNGAFIGETPTDEWVRLVVGLNVVQGGGAWHEVWFGGRNTVRRTNASNMRGGDRHCYLKLGNYRQGGKSFEVDMRFADLAIGRTREAVA